MTSVPQSPNFALAALCVAGAILFAFAAAAPWIVRSFGYQVFIPPLAASGLITIVATRLAADVPVRTGLIVVLGFALAMRLVLVGVEPLLSTDLYRYIWDGRVQAAGINPYAHVPADPALAALRDAAIYPHINRADYAVTAYPPVAADVLSCRHAHRREHARAMRLAMVGCEVVIVAAMIALLRRLALPDATVVAYAWHPLAVFEIANNGHVEALMVALMMLGVWLLVSARKVAGAVAVALAALAKPYAVLVLPAFWRPWDWRVPLAVVGGDCRLLSALSRRRQGRARLSRAGYLSEEGLLDRRGHLAGRARAGAARQAAGPHGDLRRGRRRHHGLARLARRVRRRAHRARNHRATSSCCSPPGCS